MISDKFKLALAFIALVILHVFLALSFKVAQHGSSAEYSFKPAVLLVLAELIKLIISTGLLWNESLSKYVVPTTDAVDASVKSTYLCMLFAKPPFGAIQPFLREFSSQVYFSLVWRTGVLASMYCLNNNIAFVLFRVADGANITLIKSGGSVVTALLLRFALGRAISSTQWSAIGLQVCGLVVAQFGTTCSNTPLLPWHAYGMLLVSLIMSSVCGVWNDQILKDDTHHAASMHVINILLYAYGFIINAIVFVFTMEDCTGDGCPEGTSVLAGFDEPATYMVLACQSLFGVAISAIYKYADAAIKTFALSCATSILMLVNILAFGVPFSLVVTMGCLTVFVATRLYVMNPPLQSLGPARDIVKVTPDTGDDT